MKIKKINSEIFWKVTENLYKDVTLKNLITNRAVKKEDAILMKNLYRFYLTNFEDVTPEDRKNFIKRMVDIPIEGEKT